MRSTYCYCKCIDTGSVCKLLRLTRLRLEPAIFVITVRGLADMAQLSLHADP